MALSSASISGTSSVFSNELNVVTGRTEWTVHDPDYDYAQETARSGYADMLHDHERNVLFERALVNVIGECHSRGSKAHVLDIGTGSGLLSMCAVRAGADQVTALEVFEPMAAVASQVFESNAMLEKVHLITQRSTDLKNFETGERPNICVAEVFDTELIGEGALSTFKQAHANLLAPDSRVIPSSAKVIVQCVQSNHVLKWKLLNTVHNEQYGIHITPSDRVRECAGAAAVHDVQMNQIDEKLFTRVGDPIEAFQPAKIEAPVCTCLLHMLLSRANIARLNDTQRQTCYIKAVHQVVKEHASLRSAVCLGDCDWLPLILGQSGFSTVHSVQSNAHALGLMQGLLEHNNLEGSVELVDCLEKLPKSQDEIVLVCAEPFFMSSVLPWDDLHYWYALDQYRTQNPHTTVLCCPISVTVCCVPVQFRDLHKIRAPVGKVLGFDLHKFDSIVQGSISEADCLVEPHPIWEYPCELLGEVCRLTDFCMQHTPDHYSNREYEARIPLDKPKCNGVVFWLEWQLTPDIHVSNGLKYTKKDEPCWDRCTRQGVYFLLDPPREGAQSVVHVKALFDSTNGKYNVKCSIV